MGRQLPVVFFLADRDKWDQPDCASLKYALRSMSVNLHPHPDQVVILGRDLPPWMDPSKVTQLPVGDSPNVWKDLILIQKVMALASYWPRAHIILGSDDQFLMRHTASRDCAAEAEPGRPPLSVPEDVDYQFFKDYWVWRMRLRYTLAMCREEGAPPESLLSFDSHHPFLVDLDLFSQIVFRFNALDPGLNGGHGCTIGTLYVVGGRAMRLPVQWQSPQNDIFRCSGPNLVKRGHITVPSDTRYWNLNEAKDWTYAVKVLQSRFPHPSPYERR